MICAFAPSCLVVEEPQVVAHEGHPPDRVGDLADADLWAGKPTSAATLRQAPRRLGSGPDRIVPQGFRAMASTALNEQGHPPDIIELLCAHSTTARSACPSDGR